MDTYNVAIVGATGLVGGEFIKILVERKFPVKNVRLLASRADGRVLKFGDRQIPVEETREDSFEGVDIALFSAGADISRKFAPIAARAGALVIDNSAAWRMEPDIPLVVPEVNPDDIGQHQGIIANPNCSTIQMVVVLQALHRVNPIKRVIVDTYQSVSGTGGEAIEELRAQTDDVRAGRELRPRVYPHPIAFNVLPEIDVLIQDGEHDGYYKEEWKMIQETRKIMHAPEMRISATTVRVPVEYGHSEAVHVELERPMTPGEARGVLAEASGVVVQDDPRTHLYPTALETAHTDPVYVGRIRKDASHANGLAMWIVADNIRKGAALNAVQIAELAIARGWVRRAAATA